MPRRGREGRRLCLIFYTKVDGISPGPFLSLLDLLLRNKKKIQFLVPHSISAYRDQEVYIYLKEEAITDNHIRWMWVCVSVKNCNELSTSLQAYCASFEIPTDVIYPSEKKMSCYRVLHLKGGRK